MKKLVNESIKDVLKPKPFEEAYNQLFNELYDSIINGEVLGMTRNYARGEGGSIEIAYTSKQLNAYFETHANRNGIYLLSNLKNENEIPFKNIYNFKLLDNTYRGFLIKYDVPKKGIKVFIELMMKKVFDRQISNFYIKYNKI